MNWSCLTLIASSLYILLSFTLYYAIDLKNALGSRDWLLNTEGIYFYFHYTPFFFQHYGRDGGFAEVAQWLLLATAIVISLYFAGREFINRKLSSFLLIFGLGMMLMLLEDAGELRHFFMSYIQWAAGESDQGLYGTAFEGVFFVLLGGLPVYAFWRYGSVLCDYGKAYWYILVGIVSHAIAASLSFVGTAFEMTLEVDLYSKMGEWFREYSLVIGGKELRIVWDNWDANNWLYQTNFYLMDSFVEENIELLGNAFFLAGLLTFISLYTVPLNATVTSDGESKLEIK